MIDKTEAWVFHVLCDDTGASAVWAAQRLEPDHVRGGMDGWLDVVVVVVVIMSEREGDAVLNEEREGGREGGVAGRW